MQASIFPEGQIKASEAYSIVFPAHVCCGGDFEMASAPDLLNTSASYYNPATGTTTISTIQTGNSMRVEGSWAGDGSNGNGYGGGNIQQFFRVGEDSMLLLEWDVTGTDGFARNVLLETGDGLTTLFSFDGTNGDPLSGSALIPVRAGIELAVVLGLSPSGTLIFEPNTTQFVSVTLVPAPGAAGIFGVAGLAATRRRRNSIA